jgi:hypothetical protein
MTPEKRPQDPHMDGTGQRFETMEHGGEYPDTITQAIKLIDAGGRSGVYVPITQDGKVVDNQGFVLDPGVNEQDRKHDAGRRRNSMPWYDQSGTIGRSFSEPSLLVFVDEFRFCRAEPRL